VDVPENHAGRSAEAVAEHAAEGGGISM
jgi:hypothetical protein